jgi:hypothetical protein
MDVELSEEESEAVQTALRSYLSDLRMEITDTDNPEYKRALRDERTMLEKAIEKLSGASVMAGQTAGAPSSALAEDEQADGETTRPVLRVVRLWWRTPT